MLVQQTLQAAADPMYPFSHALDLSRVADLALVRNIVGHLASGTLKVTASVVVRNGRSSHGKDTVSTEVVPDMHEAKYCCRFASSSSLQSHKHW